MATRTEEITKFAMLATEAVCRVGTLEAVHRSDPPFDVLMVLFKAVVQVGPGPVLDSLAQDDSDRPGVGAVTIGRHPIWAKAYGRSGRAEEDLRGGHVAGGAEHGVDEVSVPFDRAAEIAPPAPDLLIGFIDVAAPAGLTMAAMTPLA
jgi:hypothetical protein